MPWCDGCDRFYNPTTHRPDGTCPTCGRHVGHPAVADQTETETAEGPARDRAPWHFKLLVAATAAYLGWRLVQGIIWVAQHL